MAACQLKEEELKRKQLQVNFYLWVDFAYEETHSARLFGGQWLGEGVGVPVYLIAYKHLECMHCLV
jgi:hypothetical protein